MHPLIAHIIDTLQRGKGGDPLHEALLDAAFLFEKARGLPACAWPTRVVDVEVGLGDVELLRSAVIRFVEQEGFGSWALSKCADAALKPIFVRVLRRHVDGDANELFQAMIALSNLKEPVFGGRDSRSILDVDINRELARKYLATCGG